LIAYWRSGGTMPAPWLFVRDVLAQRWGVPPWEIDMTDPMIADDVGLTLEMMAIESRERLKD